MKEVIFSVTWILIYNISFKVFVIVFGNHYLKYVKELSFVITKKNTKSMPWLYMTHNFDSIVLLKSCDTKRSTRNFS